MLTSTDQFANLLAALARLARARGLTDTAWAARSGVRKETLSRLRSRETCDFSTLRSLAEAVGARVDVVDARDPAFNEGHFPGSIDRDYEERLVDLCASRELSAATWSRLGPPFFMAGLAVMMASARENDRRRLLELAEDLHPGASEPAVFAKWLERSPLKPSRFLPFVDVLTTRAT
jgi:DNA-binding phage protein